MTGLLSSCTIIILCQNIMVPGGLLLVGFCFCFGVGGLGVVVLAVVWFGFGGVCLVIFSFLTFILGKAVL